MSKIKLLEKRIAALEAAIQAQAKDTCDKYGISMEEYVGGLGLGQEKPIIEDLVLDEWLVLGEW